MRLLVWLVSEVPLVLVVTRAARWHGNYHLLYRRRRWETRPACPRGDVTVTTETPGTGQKHCQAWQESEGAATPPSLKCHHPSLPPSPALSYHLVPFPSEPTAICAQRNTPHSRPGSLIHISSPSCDLQDAAAGVLSQTRVIYTPKLVHISPCPPPSVDQISKQPYVRLCVDLVLNFRTHYTPHRGLLLLSSYRAEIISPKFD